MSVSLIIFLIFPGQSSFMENRAGTFVGFVLKESPAKLARGIQFQADKIMLF